MNKKFSGLCMLITLSALAVASTPLLAVPDETSEDKYWTENEEFAALSLEPTLKKTDFILANFEINPVEKTLEIKLKTRSVDTDTMEILYATENPEYGINNAILSDWCKPFSQDYKVLLSDQDLLDLKEASESENIQQKKQIINEIMSAAYGVSDIISIIKQNVNTETHRIVSYRLFNTEFRAMRAIKIHDNLFRYRPTPIEEDWSDFQDHDSDED